MIYNPMTLIQSVVDANNPALLVSDLERDAGTALSNLPAWDADVLPHAALLAHCAKSVGVIRMLNSNNVLETAGTAFLIAKGYLMTNSHVANLFIGFPGKNLQSGIEAFVTFKNNGKTALSGHAIQFGYRFLEKYAAIDSMGSDIAILKFDDTGLAPEHVPLTFALKTLDQITSPVAAIGYPSKLDTRSDVLERQAQIFGEEDELEQKRVSFDRLENLKTTKTGWRHACSVLRGSSGSPIIELETGHVVAVHRLGLEDAHSQEKYNRAIPSYLMTELLGDLQNGELAIPISISPAVGGVGLAHRKEPRQQARLQSFGVLKDNDDFRDLVYRPSLAALKAKTVLPQQQTPFVLNQLEHPSCTGHALVHLLAILQKAKTADDLLSSRMAYEMARLHDDLPGRSTQGSSLRGVIKGFFHNGLVPQKQDEWENRDWHLSLFASRKARRHTLGAYYRLSPVIQDYHCAIEEVGCVLVSAFVHKGWIEPHKTNGKIVYDGRQSKLAHAFVIVGYDETGFIVLNSAGKEWGKKGRAHWSYEDWADNLIDGWVLRPSVPAPSAFGKQVRSAVAENGVLPLPKRSEILGHFLVCEQGRLSDFGRSASNLQNIRETVKLFPSKSADGEQKYQHLLLWAHGETTKEDDALRWVGATKSFFKANKIYPVSLMTGPYHAIAFRDMLAAAQKEALQRLPANAAGFDELVQYMMMKFGPALWRNFRKEQIDAADPSCDFRKAIQCLVEHARKCGLKIHFAGHLGGCHLLADVVKSEASSGGKFDLASLQLLASNMTIAEQVEFEGHLAKSCPGFNSASLHHFCFERESKQDTGRPIPWLTLLEMSIRNQNSISFGNDRSLLMGFEDICRIGRLSPFSGIHVVQNLLKQSKAESTNLIWDADVLKSIAFNVLERKPKIEPERMQLPQAFSQV